MDKKNADDEENTAFVVVDKDEQLIGIVKRKDIFGKQHENNALISSLIKGNIAYIYPDDELSRAVDMMDLYHNDIVPVVSHGKRKKVVGVLTHKAIFAAYRKRRNEDQIYRQAILLKRRGTRIILRGRQLFSRDK